MKHIQYQNESDTVTEHLNKLPVPNISSSHLLGRRNIRWWVPPTKTGGRRNWKILDKHSHKIHETKCIFAQKNMLHDFISMESMINVGKYIPSSHGSCGPQNHRTSKSIQQLKTQGSRALNLLGNPLLWTYWVKRLDVYSCQENTTTWNGIWV